MAAITILRDLSIILLALMSIIISVIMVVLLLQIRALIVTMRQEMKPLIESGQQTADTLRYTSQFMSKRVARPVVDVISTAAGVRRGFVALREGVFGPRPAAPPPPTGASAPPASAGVEANGAQGGAE
jgi:hypothetical protein